MARLCLIVLVLLIYCNVARGALRDEFANVSCSMCDYVYRDDAYYNWELIQTEFHPGVNTYWLNVTSQMWLDDTWTTTPIWKHWVVVHVPVAIRFIDSGFIYISGGNSNNGPPDYDSDQIFKAAQLSKDIGVISAVVKQIPNQPLIYTDDPEQKSRSEDDSIAYTWRKFLDDAIDNSTTANPEELLRMPMCKGAVKSLDAVTEFVKQQYSYDIVQWMMGGESKRGWTTWILGAMDDRVIAIAPVIETWVNMVEVMNHYIESFGGWPFFFWDYWIQGTLQFLNDPEFLELTAVDDPFSYIDGLKMPIFMISSASDEFFLLTDTWYFMDQLPGEAHIWFIENSGHGTGEWSDHYDEVWDLLTTFCLGVLLDLERPSFEEHKTTDGSGGSIYIRTPIDWVPLDVTAYYADSVVPDRRDWRLRMLQDNSTADIDTTVTTGIYWDTTPVTELGNHIYQAHMDLPTEGYRAFYITATFAGPEGGNYTFSSEAHVIPEGFPYPKCTTRAECQGELV